MSRCHSSATLAGTVRSSCPFYALYSLDLSILLKRHYQEGSPRSWSGFPQAVSRWGCGCPNWNSLWKEQATCVTHTLSPRRQAEARKPKVSLHYPCPNISLPANTQLLTPRPSRASFSLPPPLSVLSSVVSFPPSYSSCPSPAPSIGLFLSPFLFLPRPEEGLKSCGQFHPPLDC